MGKDFFHVEINHNCKFFWKAHLKPSKKIYIYNFIILFFGIRVYRSYLNLRTARRKHEFRDGERGFNQVCIYVR